MAFGEWKSKVKNFFGSDDDDYVVEETEVEETYEEEKIIKKENKDESRKRSKMSIFRSRNEGSTNTMGTVSIIRPKTYEDARSIADAIKAGNVVNFSLEFLESEIGNKVLDFVSGAAYVTDAHLMLITGDVFSCIPSGINIDDIDTSLEENL